MTDLNERALKPCPFCGKAAQIAPDEIGSGGQHVPPYHAGCFRGAGCGIAFTADDPDEAIAEWNRRALTSATPPDVAGLIQRLEADVAEQRSHGEPINGSLVLEAVTALRLSAGGGWRTMDSAPKDGTRFLALQGSRHFDCWWHDAGYGEAYWQDECDSEPNPDRWQPLPASPTVEAGHVE